MNAEQQLKLIQIELRQCREENTRLRKKLGENTRHYRRVEKAYRDALILAELHVGYVGTTRRTAGDLVEMTQRRWQNALALLKMARCHDGRRWTAHDLLTIETRLQRAFTSAIETPESYKSRLPLHGRK